MPDRAVAKCTWRNASWAPVHVTVPEACPGRAGAEADACNGCGCGDNRSSEISCREEWPSYSGKTQR